MSGRVDRLRRIVDQRGLTMGAVLILRYFVLLVGRYSFGTLVALLSNVLDGRSFRESRTMLGYWGPVDRIDPLLRVPQLVPHQYDSAERSAHISRYLFAARTFFGQDEQDTGRHLDVAAGLGYGSTLLTRWLDCTYVGVEISESATRYATRHYGADGRFIQADITNLPFETDSFETISCFETMEHVPDEHSMLEELNRVLTKDGHLVVSVPNDEDIDAELEREKEYPHVNRYTSDEFVQSLRDVFTDSTITLFGQYSTAEPLLGFSSDEPPTPTGIYERSDPKASDQLIAHVTKNSDSSRSG